MNWTYLSRWYDFACCTKIKLLWKFWALTATASLQSKPIRYFPYTHPLEVERKNPHPKSTSACEFLIWFEARTPSWIFTLLIAFLKLEFWYFLFFYFKTTWHWFGHQILLFSFFLVNKNQLLFLPTIKHELLLFSGVSLRS